MTESALPCPICNNIPKVRKFRDGANKRVIIRCCGYVDGCMHDFSIESDGFSGALDIWNKLPRWSD